MSDQPQAIGKSFSGLSGALRVSQWLASEDLAGLGLATAGLFFIVRLAVGSAPLPAGFGV